MRFAGSGPVSVGLGAVLAALWVPAITYAQSGGSIAGVVRDQTGAVLPGVTVEAASPALIEKVRSVVTDDQGRYQIVELRPGTYAVTFTLPGFATVKRDGIELTTGFTATLNADLKVGTLEETVTVSGTTPVVDVQNVRAQTVLTREVLDAIPVRPTTQGFAAVTLGATVGATQQDVGGSRGESVSGTAIHGISASDAVTSLDGTKLHMVFGTGGGALRWYKVNQVMAQEVTLSTGNTAEFETGGMATNVVQKDGGNRFSFYSLANYAGEALQSENLGSYLRERGLTVTTREKRIYDTGIGVGGPIRRDKVWFYAGFRHWATVEQQAGGYHNKLNGTLFYEPDFSRPAVAHNWADDESIRLTWNPTQKQKVTYLHSYQNSCTCPFNISAGQLLAYEAANELHYRNVNLAQATWNYPVTNRFLIEAGASYLYNHSEVEPNSDTVPDAPNIFETTTGYSYGANIAPSFHGVAGYSVTPNYSNVFSTRASALYVTGSHAFKVGFTASQGLQDSSGYVTNNGVSYRFTNQKPVSLTVFATPGWSQSRVRLNLGTFAQDQWTLGRLTLNLGVRFDRLDSYNPAQTRPGGIYLAPLSFPEQPCVPCWNDISPRLGAAYDVFGNGKTAVKAYFGKYMNLESTSIASNANPSNAISFSTPRNWQDDRFGPGDPRSGNFFPDCVLTDPADNGECGPSQNAAFGTVRITTRYNPALLEGWGDRPYNWQANIAIQQELRQGLALNVAYFRTWYGNFLATQNLSVSPADYNSFCVTVPTDERIPGGGGNQLCGFNDLHVNASRVQNNLITHASNIGEQSLVYDGIDVSVNARFGEGGLLSGGFNTGRQVADACDIALAHPEVTTSLALAQGGISTGPTQSTEFCRITLPWAAQTQVKFSGAYPLPWWRLQVAATYQNLVGATDSASHTYTNAQVLSSLGRNLGSCALAATTCNAQAAVGNLFAPNTKRENRINQTDLRFSRPFRLRNARFTGMFDIYNLFNASTITAVSTVYASGTQWLRPTAFLPGRLLKFGLQVNL